MNHQLQSRERAMQLLRGLVHADPWLLLYALLYACEAHDLGTLNRMLEAVQEQADRPDREREDRLAALMTERFGQ